MAYNANLNLGVIGNCAMSALVDERARIVWSCMPRFDSDPVFCSLLTGEDPASDTAQGFWDVEVENLARHEQRYIKNTAILVTRLEDDKGCALDIIDFAPRFTRLGRKYRPLSLIRMLRPVSGTPRVRVRLRPMGEYGAEAPQVTKGSNHIRYLFDDITLRLNTTAPLTYVRNETWFNLEQETAFFLGPDEPFSGPILPTCRDFLESTGNYWREWVRHLAVPLEWQDAVIRAAITLKLCYYEETGAIIAAMTTSVPEAADSGRTWDYRFCWIRDAYYVVRALNRLGAVDIMEGYLSYLRNIVGVADGGYIQPVYGIGLEAKLTERQIAHLDGYRGMGPVRVGNQAHEHIQHDVYGQVVLSAAQAFFDERLLAPVGRADFEMLEKVGKRAFDVHAEPDAGLWELRTKASIHTYSSAMCWAACDRLANIAQHLDLPDSGQIWRERADRIRAEILTRSFSKENKSLSAVFDSFILDASLMQLMDLGFLEPQDPLFVSTLQAVEKELLKGDHIMRYAVQDDFGAPENAFNICTFWYIEALWCVGRKERAREIFETMLAHRNHVGLLSEDISFSTGELWGNYPQTYSLVGIINTAMLLSRPWSHAR